MKRLIAAVITLTLIIGFCVYSSFEIKKRTDMVLNGLEETINLFDKGKYEESVASLQQLEENWISSEGVMIQLVNRQRLEEIGEHLAVAKAFAKEEDKAEFSAVCEELKIMIAHLVKEEGFII